MLSILLTACLLFLPSIICPACQPDAYMTIQKLTAYCELRGVCGGRLCCEGEMVRIKGYLDYVNIVHTGISHNAGRSKFRIIDGPNINLSSNPWDHYTHSLEVYPVSGDIDNLFRKLVSISGLPLKIVYLKGVIRGFDMYTEQRKSRGIKLEVKAENVIIEGGNQK